MREIAGLVGVTPAEVNGTCSFYTMFKRRPCGRYVVSVCTNVTCLVLGGPEILEHLEERYADDGDVTVEEVECLAACGNAPSMQVNYEFHEHLNPEVAAAIVDDYKSGVLTARGVSGGARCERARPRRGSSRKRLHDRPEDSWTIDGALASGAYESLQAGADHDARGDRPGRGEGVGPARPRRRRVPGRHQVVVPRAGLYPRYLVVNGDEGEPSTFKDRMLVERDPHQLVEGIAIAAFSVECHLAFVYLRGEFALGYERLTEAIRDALRRRASSARTSRARASTSTSSCTAAPARTSAARRARSSRASRASAGCRASSRRSPPSQGLYAKPTVVNNVETLSTLPHIIAMGGEKYAEFGVEPLHRHAHLLGVGSRARSRATTRSSSASRSATSSTRPSSAAASATTGR